MSDIRKQKRGTIIIPLILQSVIPSNTANIQYQIPNFCDCAFQAIFKSMTSSIVYLSISNKNSNSTVTCLHCRYSLQDLWSSVFTSQYQHHFRCHEHCLNGLLENNSEKWASHSTRTNDHQHFRLIYLCETCEPGNFCYIASYYTYF